MNNEKNLENSGIRQKTHDGVDKIIDRGESIKQSTDEQIDLLKDKANLIRENVDNYIKKNPEKSVLIAAGVGIVLGAILAAAMLRRKN